MTLRIFDVERIDEEVVVYLGTWSTDHKGTIHLTAKCITPQEWDAEIDLLIKHLERTRKRGHRILDRVKEEIKRRIEARI